MAVVLVDASVLYGAPVRDLVLELAVSDLLRARWTERINDEWIAAILRRRPDLTMKQMERTRSLMAAHARDAIVTGYEKLIDALRLPDRHDRHVLAAAIHGRAEVIMTFNLRDFPPRALLPHGIRAIHPDVFLADLARADGAAALAAAERIRGRLSRPNLDWAGYMKILARAGLRRTARRLEELRHA